MKKIFLASLAVMVAVGCANAGNKSVSSSSDLTAKPSESKSQEQPLVVTLSQSDFKEMIEDYTTKEWDYKGELPAVVDFYADWCGPCRRLAPIMKEVAGEFDGKVKFYKVNVDNAQALARAYGVSSIPMVLFIPVNGKPVTNLGLMSKEDFIKKVETNCLGK